MCCFTRRLSQHFYTHFCWNARWKASPRLCSSAPSQEMACELWSATFIVCMWEKRQGRAKWCMWEQNMEQYNKCAALNHWQGGGLLENADSKALHSECFILMSFSCKCALQFAWVRWATCKKSGTRTPRGKLVWGLVVNHEGCARLWSYESTCWVSPSV